MLYERETTFLLHDIKGLGSLAGGGGHLPPACSLAQGVQSWGRGYLPAPPQQGPKALVEVDWVLGTGDWGLGSLAGELTKTTFLDFSGRVSGLFDRW